MEPKGKKRRVTLSGGALLHEGTRLIKGVQIANKDTCDFCCCCCHCLKLLFDQEVVCLKEYKLKKNIHNSWREIQKEI